MVRFESDAAASTVGFFDFFFGPSLPSVVNSDIIALRLADLIATLSSTTADMASLQPILHLRILFCSSHSILRNSLCFLSAASAWDSRPGNMPADASIHPTLQSWSCSEEDVSAKYVLTSANDFMAPAKPGKDCGRTAGGGVVSVTTHEAGDEAATAVWVVAAGGSDNADDGTGGAGGMVDGLFAAAAVGIVVDITNSGAVAI